MLAELHSFYKNSCRSLKTKVYSEREPLLPFGIIVDRNSSDDDLSDPIPVDADHSEICKFATREAYENLGIKRFMLDVIKLHLLSNAEAALKEFAADVDVNASTHAVSIRIVENRKPQWNRFVATVNSPKVFNGSVNLSIQSCPLLTSLDCFNSERLRRLSVVSCDFLVDTFSHQGVYPQNLEVLSIQQCRGVQSFSGDLPKLWFLDLSRSQSLHDIGGIHQLPALQTLDISECDSLIKTKIGGQCRKLKYLNLSGSSEVRDLDCLRELPCLEILDLTGCTNIESFSSMSSLAHLRILILRDLESQAIGARFLPDLSVLASMPALTAVYVDPVSWNANSILSRVEAIVPEKVRMGPVKASDRVLSAAYARLEQ